MFCFSVCSSVHPLYIVFVLFLLGPLLSSLVALVRFYCCVAPFLLLYSLSLVFFPSVLFSSVLAFIRTFFFVYFLLFDQLFSSFTVWPVVLVRFYVLLVRFCCIVAFLLFSFVRLFLFPSVLFSSNHRAA